MSEGLIGGSFKIGELAGRSGVKVTGKADKGAALSEQEILSRGNISASGWRREKKRKMEKCRGGGGRTFLMVDLYIFFVFIYFFPTSAGMKEIRRGGT